MASFTSSFPQIPQITHRVDASESTLTDIPKEIFKDPIHQEDDLWTIYVKEAGSFDQRIIDDWNKILDVTLIFVGLMISVLASFILEYSQQLKPDPDDVTHQLLIAIYNQSVNASTPANVTALLTHQDHGDYQDALTNNAFLYSSLGLCTTASVFALAAKLWLISYGDRALSAGTEYYRAMKRQKAYSGVLAWKMGAVIQSLPLILLVALVLFMFFIHNSIFSTQEAISYAVGTFLGTSLIAFGVACLAAAFIPACPFHSSFSTIIRFGWKQIQKMTNRVPLLLRIGLFVIIWFGSGSVIAWATIEHSSNYFPLVYVPITLSFAFSMGEEEEKKRPNKPQAYRLPLLTFLTFLVIAPILAAAGYFGKPKKYPIFVGLYIPGMLLLFAFGILANRMSKSKDETAEIDAIIWLLTSTSTPDPKLFKKAGQLASHDGGVDYRPRLLKSLLPLLSARITSNRPEVKPQDLEIYVSCLALLSDFKPYTGSIWLLREDARSRPELGASLGERLGDLAKDQSSSVGRTAKQLLEVYGLDEEGEQRPELHKRQMSGDSASVLTYVESVYSYEEMELHSRRKNGYCSVDV